MKSSQVFAAVLMVASCGLLVVNAQNGQQQQFNHASQPQDQQPSPSEQEYYNTYYRQHFQTQPSDDTHFRDFYTQLLPYRPSVYASQNYFNQPATPTDYNYYIAPADTNGNSLDGTLDAQVFETHGNHI